MSTVMKYLVPLVFTVGLCWILFSSMSLEEMVTIVREQCDYRWILLSFAINIVSHIVRALRWRIQLRALGVKPPLYALVYSIFGTYAVNLVLPRMGEIWRTGYISQRQDAPFATVFGSMVADRLADTIAVALITASAFIMASGTLTAYMSQEGGMLDTVGRIVSSPWLWIPALIIILLAWRLLCRQWPEDSIMGKIKKFIGGLWEGFAVILTMPGKARWLCLTILTWVCYFMQLYVVFYAFPFTADILHEHGAVAVLVAFSLSSISMGIPSNGGIGPWQWAIIFALGIYGLGRQEAATFANLVMGSQTLLLIVLGIITFIGIALDKRRSAVDR